MKLNLSVCGENKEEIIDKVLGILKYNNLSSYESDVGDYWLYWTNGNDPKTDLLLDEIIDPHTNDYVCNLGDFLRQSR